MMAGSRPTRVLRKRADEYPVLSGRARERVVREHLDWLGGLMPSEARRRDTEAAVLPLRLGERMR